MRFEKRPKTIEEQVALLIFRGMQGDPTTIANRLAMANYYRLSGYWFSFRKADGKFHEGTLFAEVWRRYTFDRHLRLLVMDALERIEVTVRTQFAYHHAHLHGPFAYYDDPFSLPKLSLVKRKETLVKIESEIGRSREPFMEHFRANYSPEHRVPPIWCAIEVVSFGTLVTLYRNSSKKVKKAIAGVFEVPSEVFESWVLALNTLRNICAHHSRLWNRELGVKPLIPLEKDYPEWHHPVQIGNDRLFGILSICKHCLDRIAPQSHWPLRLSNLLHNYPEIPLRSMGFSDQWQASPIWMLKKEGGVYE
jgi:abortive infection bacteriophage resistance protein